MHVKNMGQAEVYSVLRRFGKLKYVYFTAEFVAEKLGVERENVVKNLLKLFRNGDVERIIVKLDNGKRIYAYRLRE